MGSDCVLDLAWGWPLTSLMNAHVLRTYHAAFMVLSVMKGERLGVNLGGKWQDQLFLDLGAVWRPFQITCS